MKIGLTYTGFPAKHNNYINWLQQSDSTVEIVTLSVAQNNLHELEYCDGLILSGGVDVTPSIYGKDENYPEKPALFESERDAFEMAAFNYCQLSNLPVLGICRGLQLINCIFGGTLRQDLGVANSIHKAIVDQHSNRQFDKAHGIHIHPGSYLFSLAKADRLLVNSAHHQCADNIADALIATCHSDDGVVEGLEWKHKDGRPFLLCVQWHPERFYEFQIGQSAMSQGIRDIFIAACNGVTA